MTPAAGPPVSVVIPCYNQRAYTLRCLESLRLQEGTEREVLVVDNASTDQTLEAVAAAFPEVRVLRSEVNRGYAGGCNLGIRSCSGRYVLLLNNDTRVLARDFLEVLVRTLDRDSRLGILGVREVEYGDPSKVLFDGGQDGLGFPKISGAAMCIRRVALQEVGLLDESLFAYFEDSDLVARLRERGWQVGHVSEVSVAHARSLTAGLGSPFYYYHMNRNLVVFLRRHASVSTLLLRVLPRWLPTTGWFLRSALSRRQWGLLRAWAGGLHDGVRAALADQPQVGPPLNQAAA